MYQQQAYDIIEMIVGQLEDVALREGIVGGNGRHPSFSLPSAIRFGGGTAVTNNNG